MINIFNFKKKKQETKELLEARQEFIEKRKKIVSEFIQKNLEYLEKERERLQKQDLLECNLYNSKCPICGSTNRINKYVMLKGDVHGSINPGLFSSSGNISGSLDTLKVNECKDCGNQWEIREPEHDFVGDYLDDPFSTYPYSSPIGLLYRMVERIQNNDRYYPEKLLTLFTPFQNCPREILEQRSFLYWKSEEEFFDDTQLLGIPIVKKENSKEYNNDPFLFQFSPEVWEIFKKVLFRND